MSRLKLLTLLFTIALFTLLAAGCGSSGGSGGSPTIRVVTPADDATFAAGGVIAYRLRVGNFDLMEPTAAHALSFRHHAEDHEETGDEGSGSTDNGDDHSAAETNPDAREGHYHIYLDEASGTDPHVTAWSLEGEYQLAADIAPGTHSLRFELRDNVHTPVGVETVLFFNVE